MDLPLECTLNVATIPPGSERSMQNNGKTGRVRRYVVLVQKPESKSDENKK